MVLKSGRRQQAPSVAAYNLRRRSDHTVGTQQHALSGSLTMVGKTPKLQVEFPIHLLVYQILTRLPVKTLSRFRCVSKPLCSFISDPHFQKLHAHRSQKKPFLLVAKFDTTGFHFSTYTINGEKTFRDFSISFAGPPDEILTGSFEIVQACLGLVCLRTDCNGALLIFNPATAELVTLPPRPAQLLDLCAGFGYTDFSDEFKVVRFFTRHLCSDDCDAYEIMEHCPNEVCFSEVFTLGSSDGWRETRSPPPFKPCGFGHMPLVHGALHFLPSLNYHGHERDRHYIAAFDLHTEHYGQIPVPKIYFASGLDDLDQCQMTELRGSLCVSFDFFKSKKLLQLWFLKDYHGGKWVKEFNIKLSYEVDLFSAFAVPGNGRVLLSIRFSKKERELCYYNAKKNCIENMFGTNCSGMFYVDTFLPPSLFGK